VVFVVFVGLWVFWWVAGNGLRYEVWVYSSFGRLLCALCVWVISLFVFVIWWLHVINVHGANCWEIIVCRAKRLVLSLLGFFAVGVLFGCGVVGFLLVGVVSFVFVFGVVWVSFCFVG